MEVEDAIMLTDGVTEVVVIVIVLLTAVDVVRQFAFDIIITLTMSPFEGDGAVKEEKVAPATFKLFTCHW